MANPMVIKKILTSMLTGTLALYIAGCGKNETSSSLNSQDYNQVHQQVKNGYGGSGTNLKASRVNYLQNSQIIENNFRLLEQRGLEADINKYLTKAKELQLSAENDWYGGSGANIAYKEALFQQNEAILVQQRILLGNQK